jgi:hypothetical protein
MSVPRLSVIVPSVNGAADLFGALDALAVNARDVELEVLVPDRLGEPLRSDLKRRYPAVRLLEAAAGTSIPTLRAMAFEAARAPAVAVIEDHVIVPAGWAQLMLAALDRGEQVVGGAVVNVAKDRLVDRAAFLCEYSHLLPPLPAGPSTWLTGNNTAYRRNVVIPHLALIAAKWENALHDELRRDGVLLHFHPEIVVGHKKHYTAREYTAQRYLYSRGFSGVRFAGRSAVSRVMYAAAAAALPAVLLARILRRAWASTADRSTALRAMPLLIVFVCAWALGDAVGALAGPGDSFAKVR